MLLLSLYPDPSWSTHCPKLHPPLSPGSHCGGTPGWPRETELSNWHTHIIAHQYMYSIRAEMIGNQSYFDLPPPPSSLGPWRLITKSLKNVWKYLRVHNSHVEVKSVDATHLSDNCTGTSAGSRWQLHTSCYHSNRQSMWRLAELSDAVKVKDLDNVLKGQCEHSEWPINRSGMK